MIPAKRHKQKRLWLAAAVDMDSGNTVYGRSKYGGMELRSFPPAILGNNF
jgi:hypothetical protein